MAILKSIFNFIANIVFLNSSKLKYIGNLGNLEIYATRQPSSSEPDIFMFDDGSYVRADGTAHSNKTVIKVLNGQLASTYLGISGMRNNRPKLKYIGNVGILKVYSDRKPQFITNDLIYFHDGSYVKSDGIAYSTKTIIRIVRNKADVMIDGRELEKGLTAIFQK